MRAFGKLLIADCGLVGGRILRAAHDAGLRTVLASAGPPRDAWWLPHVDEAVWLAAEEADPDGRGEDLLAAAEATDADAVHPGGGLLARDAGFADAVLGSGRAWIGAPPTALRMLGEPAAWRASVARAGLSAQAGPPGNRRPVRVQLLAAADGVVVVGSRECSLRRGADQLVIEAPARLDDRSWQRLRAAARMLAGELGHRGPATAEFLLGDDGRVIARDFEVRLLPDVAVTEETVGIDLVRAGFRGAAGESPRLPDDPPARGHSIAFRLDSHGSGAGAEPATIRLPAGPGVRVECATPFASRLPGLPAQLQLVVTGASRREALQRSRRALAELRIEGGAAAGPVLRLVEEYRAFVAAAEEAETVREVEGVQEEVARMASGEPTRGALARAVVRTSAPPGRALTSASDVSILPVSTDWPTSRPTGRLPVASTAEADAGDLSGRETLLARRAARAGSATVGGRQFSALGRIEQICDPGSFVEVQPFRRGATAAYGGTGRAADGDGVVAGTCLVDGRPVAVIAHDFAVAGGSIGSAFAERVVRVQQLAMEVGAPIVYLNDSGGARIHEGIASLHGCGRVFSHNVRARARVPQISVILGPCAGAAAYSPALTDWTIMVRGRGQMFLTGPEVVRAAIGEAVHPEDLGGALLHTRDSGVAHLDVPDERAAFAAVRQLLSFLPSRVSGPLPRIDPVPPVTDPALLPTLVPAAPSQPFNMRRVLAAVLDGGDELELMPRFGPSLLTGLARLDGWPVGVVASQPRCRGGVLDAESAYKCARLVSFCGRFGLPVLTFLDVPGFMPGSAEERKGVIRAGADMLAAYVEAAVPKLTLVVRKAYGGSYIAMGSASLGADRTWAWPSAELAVMGPEAAVGLLHRRELAGATDAAARRSRLTAEYRAAVAHPFLAAENGIVDEVILPEESRDRMRAALHLLLSKGAH